MKIRKAEQGDLNAWVKLRNALWPHHSIEELEADAMRMLSSEDEICFLLIREDLTPVGFIEAKIYHSRPEPYGHVEGWYVDPEYRRKGWGGELVGEVEQWCLHQAIPRLTSDTTPDYPISPAAHHKAGFRELAKFTIFCKDISQITHS